MVCLQIWLAFMCSTHNYSTTRRHNVMLNWAGGRLKIFKPSHTAHTINRKMKLEPKTVKSTYMDIFPITFSDSLFVYSSFFFVAFLYMLYVICRLVYAPDSNYSLHFFAPTNWNSLWNYKHAIKIPKKILLQIDFCKCATLIEVVVWAQFWCRRKFTIIASGKDGLFWMTLMCPLVE